MINFPKNPAFGDKYSKGIKSWTYNGRAWELQAVGDSLVQRAESAAVAAQASQILADKRFLGNKAAPPATDNQGAALEAGAAYYDTTLQKIQVWSGAAWVVGINTVAGVSSLNGNVGALTLKTINGMALDGAGDIAPVAIQRFARVANTQLVAADKSKWLSLSGTFTQTFDTVANLGQGWFVYISNKGTGNITIPLSDGVANWIMYPGETRLFVCDGTNLASVVLSAYRYSSQVSGTWIKPPGYNYHRERLTGGGQGGGGGGSGAAGNNASNQGTSPGQGGTGGAGGAGGTPGVTIEAIFLDSVLPLTVPFVIGAGGTGGAGGIAAAGGAANTSNAQVGVAGAAGVAGGASTFGTVGALYYLSAPGGTAFSNGGVGGSGPTVAGPNNTNAAMFGATVFGAYSLPTVAAGASGSGTSTASLTTASPGGPGGNGGPSGMSTYTPTPATGGNGGIASAAVYGSPGNAGAAAPAVTTSLAGCGGGGGGGGSGSTGCGSVAGQATGSSGAGGRGADGAPGMLEMAGII